MSKDNSKQSAFILDALKVVQEGLKSMQHLQSQTAAAHQKFLEAQTEANRSLQAMMPIRNLRLKKWSARR